MLGSTCKVSQSALSSAGAAEQHGHMYVHERGWTSAGRCKPRTMHPLGKDSLRQLWALRGLRPHRRRQPEYGKPCLPSAV